MSSQVYFTNLRTKPGTNLLDKLEKLVKRAGIEKIDFKDKLVAIKIHFGEAGNLAYIRPNYAARIVEIVQALGGKPFVTDANTLYVGKRANAVDHLETAFKNGFNPISLGCPVIIADGLKGADFTEIPLGLKHCETAKIGTAIADADVFISLAHFKGHEMTCFGGALKNIGMGSGSRGGKLQMHSNSKPYIDLDACVGCRMCMKNCAQDAITMNADNKAVINYDLCVGCGQCIAVCDYNAARPNWDESSEYCTEKIAEYSLAVIKDKPNFHVNFVMDISPDCDCWNLNDLPIAADVGILASSDPVALDRASVDLVNAAPMIPGSRLDETGYKPGEDKFRAIHPDTDWQPGLLHAEAIGVGTQEYELITVK
ncbi:MAG: DUF362 domain-containing protein [Anaerolineae bacterium]|jgi:uncharacterized Fe-S center protein|nr:DUF362 domain-containing protein [Anaerolineae bacterium]